ncbi:Muscular LMNA-interacting protein [Apodemus speciosus]|uniref:Muscular LMNA-interacting protein n=1 Tax=Apodemus speciosus TaxID=105296 RepID=A0ABQ0F5T8_APOSI
MTSCILAGSIETTPKVSPGDSEAKPLIFTFVPTLRRLPTHIQLADTSKFLVKIPEEPTDKSPETVNRFEYSDHMTFSCESKQERERRILDYPSEVSGRNSQQKEFNTKEPQGMQKGDLFKAEYVFIVDSDGEDEATCRQGEQGPPGGTGNVATRPKSLAISSSLASDVVRPKVRGADLKASSHPETPPGMAPQQKHGQLTSPTTSERLAHKAPAFSFVSPTNQKTPPVPANVSGAAVLEEFHTCRLHRLDATGASEEETATYFHTTAHDSPLSAWKGASTLVFSPSAQLPGSSSCGSNVTDHTRGLAPEAQKKMSTSSALNPREDVRTSPSPASGASLKSPSASYIPVRIVMHSLSPSPKPLTSSSHGSLSTVCSQMSSSGNLSKSGLKSPVPSRLSLLTAILKSNPSHQRPLSPASCPTFSLNSLASSTLTLDQKVKQTPPTPKKSLSSCSLTAGSTEQEHQASAKSHQHGHLPFFSKTTPLSQAHPLSPSALASSTYASVDREKITGSPLRSNTTPPQLQTDTFSLADVPSVTLGLSPLSSSKGRKDGDLRAPEKNRNICIHPSTVSSTPLDESSALSSSGKCFHPSPALSDLIDRSKRACSQQQPGQQPSTSALPAPPVSRAGSASHPRGGCSRIPPESSLTQALQPSPSALRPSCGSPSCPSRTGMPESTASNHRSRVLTPSLPVSLTRTKELPTPCALSMSTGPENKKPKQYKTIRALDEPARTESNSKTPTTHPRAAGRETKYANLSSPSSTASESQLTKPGVIRPVPIKSRLLLKKEEEIYEPNPFSKYLEDNSGLFSEQ